MFPFAIWRMEVLTNGSAGGTFTLFNSFCLTVSSVNVRTRLTFSTLREVEGVQFQTEGGSLSTRRSVPLRLSLNWFNMY